MIWWVLLVRRLRHYILDYLKRENLFKTIKIFALEAQVDESTKGGIYQCLCLTSHIDSPSLIMLVDGIIMEI